MELQFNVAGQFISVVGEPVVVADSQKQITLKFIFDDKWLNTNKTAIIKTGGQIYYALINSDGVVPAEYVPVLKSGLCYFSVYAGDIADDTAIHTANDPFIDILPSGFANGVFPEILTPDMLQQLYNIIGNLETALVAILGV